MSYLTGFIGFSVFLSPVSIHYLSSLPFSSSCDSPLPILSSSQHLTSSLINIYLYLFLYSVSLEMFIFKLSLLVSVVQFRSTSAVGPVYDATPASESICSTYLVTK